MLIFVIIFVKLELLDLTNQIDADTLSSVMEEFVEVFSEELTPYAIQLTEQLVYYEFKIIFFYIYSSKRNNMNTCIIYREILFCVLRKITRIQKPFLEMENL